jgi:2'-5' RNA ligase
MENDMGWIATDVVLLPDRTMTRWAIEINRELVCRYGSEIVLSETTCLPHISLAMGCIDERSTETVHGLLLGLARETPVRQLSTIGIRISTNSRGEHTSLLEIERTHELQALHEAVMREIEPLSSDEVTEGMVAADVVAESTLEWIRNYPRKAAFDQFSPHITLGYGQARTDDRFPIPFAAVQLALCHLGNHCTCRRVLTTSGLPANDLPSGSCSSCNRKS